MQLDRIKEKEANTWRSNHFSRLSANDNCVIFEVIVFPLSNIPHFIVGSLSLPYLSSEWLKDI
jgi:hypothetical protein